MGDNKAEGADARLAARKSSIGGVVVKLPSLYDRLWKENGIRVTGFHILLDRSPNLLVVRGVREGLDKVVKFVPFRDLGNVADALAHGGVAEGWKADRPWTPEQQAAKNRRDL